MKCDRVDCERIARELSEARGLAERRGRALRDLYDVTRGARPPHGVQCLCVYCENARALATPPVPAAPLLPGQRCGRLLGHDTVNPHACSKTDEEIWGRPGQLGQRCEYVEPARPSEPVTPGMRPGERCTAFLHPAEMPHSHDERLAAKWATGTSKAMRCTHVEPVAVAPLPVEPVACLSWCGNTTSPTPPIDHASPYREHWTRANAWWCSLACADAGRPAHPATPRRTT